MLNSLQTKEYFTKNTCQKYFHHHQFLEQIYDSQQYPYIINNFYQSIFLTFHQIFSYFSMIKLQYIVEFMLNLYVHSNFFIQDL
jgi:hypothetical protein